MTTKAAAVLAILRDLDRDDALRTCYGIDPRGDTPAPLDVAIREWLDEDPRPRDPVLMETVEASSITISFERQASQRALWVLADEYTIIDPAMAEAIRTRLLALEFEPPAPLVVVTVEEGDIGIAMRLDGDGPDYAAGFAAGFAECARRFDKHAFCFVEGDLNEQFDKHEDDLVDDEDTALAAEARALIEAKR